MNDINAINLTPHEITLRAPDGTDTVVPPSGQLARVSMVETEAGFVAGMPVIRRESGKFTGLPPEQDGVIILVSSMVLDKVSGRIDVFAPDTGEDSAIRNDRGHVVAVTRLVASKSQ